MAYGCDEDESVRWIWIDSDLGGDSDLRGSADAEVDAEAKAEVEEGGGGEGEDGGEEDGSACPFARSVAPPEVVEDASELSSSTSGVVAVAIFLGINSSMNALACASVTFFAAPSFPAAFLTSAPFPFAPLITPFGFPPPPSAKSILLPTSTQQ